MSIVVFVSQTKPEKGLKHQIKMKAYLSSEQKEEIIQQIKEQWNKLDGNMDDYIITMTVDIELKKYDTKDT